MEEKALQPGTYCTGVEDHHLLCLSCRQLAGKNATKQPALHVLPHPPHQKTTQTRPENKRIYLETDIYSQMCTIQTIHQSPISNIGRPTVSLLSFPYNTAFLISLYFQPSCAIECIHTHAHTQCDIKRRTEACRGMGLNANFMFCSNPLILTLMGSAPLNTK